MTVEQGTGEGQSEHGGGGCATPTPMTRAQIRELSAAQLVEQLVGHLEAVNRRLRRSGRERFDELGVTPAQFRMLRALHHVGTPIRIKDLAERLDIVPRSATSAVDDLERLGLVVRSPDRRDRRSTLVSITDDGEALMSSARHQRKHAVASLLDTLDDADQRRLLELLDKLTPGCC